MSNKVKITNSKQFELLVSFMEKNQDIAKGYNKNLTKIEVQKKWDIIAETLNSFGPPERDGESWQKVWIDMKFNVKKKVIHNNSNAGNTARQRTPYILSSLQESVAALLGYDQMGTGNGVAQYEPMATTTTANIPTYTPQSCPASPTTNFEFASTSMASNADDINIEFIEGINTDDEQLQQNNSSNERTSYRLKKNVIREKLLRKQTEMQTTLCKEISYHLKETQRYQKLRYDLEEERLKLYKMELERNEKHRVEENKFRQMQIELKKRRLELEERKLEMLDTDDEDKPLSATQRRRRKRQ